WGSTRGLLAPMAWSLAWPLAVRWTRDGHTDPAALPGVRRAQTLLLDQMGRRGARPAHRRAPRSRRRERAADAARPPRPHRDRRRGAPRPRASRRRRRLA